MNCHQESTNYSPPEGFCKLHLPIAVRKLDNTLDTTFLCFCRFFYHGGSKVICTFGLYCSPRSLPCHLPATWCFHSGTQALVQVEEQQLNSHAHPCLGPWQDREARPARMGPSESVPCTQSAHGSRSDQPVPPIKALSVQMYLFVFIWKAQRQTGSKTDCICWFTPHMEDTSWGWATWASELGILFWCYTWVTATQYMSHHLLLPSAAGSFFCFLWTGKCVVS